MKSNIIQKKINLRENYKKTGLFLIIYILCLLIYGVWPEQWWGFPGSVDFGVPNLSISKLFYNEHVGYPLGSFNTQGLPYLIIRSVIVMSLGCSEYFAAQIEVASILFASMIGFILLSKQFKVNIYISIFLAFVFLITPINIGHMRGYPSLAMSMLLVPLGLYFEIKLLEIVLRNKLQFDIKMVKFLIPVLLLKIWFMFGNGYAFVFYNFICFFIILFGASKNFKSNFLKTIFILFVFFLFNIIAIFLYKLYIPGGAEYVKMPMSFFRAQGVDIISLFIPGNNFLFPKLLGYGKAWDALAYYGDGSNILLNYIGITFIFIIGVAFFKRTINTPILKGLLIAGVIALIISFGPSLKINVKKDNADKKISFNSYLMDKEDANMRLPTAFICDLPGFKNMRSVYRWIYIPKLILLIIAGTVLTFSHNRGNKKLVFALILLMSFEFFPDVKSRIVKNKAEYKMGQRFSADITDVLSKYMEDNNKIFIYSKENDFLARIIGNRYDSFLYNAGGDKKLKQVRKAWPENILKIYKAENNLNELVFSAMQAGDLYTFILPKFNLRWNFYSWPPNKNKVNEYEETNSENFAFSDLRFTISEEKYFTVITMSKKISFDNHL